VNDFARLRISDAHPSGAKISGIGLQVILRNHEMNRENNIQREFEFRIATPLQDK
jgi:hypothetical protein